MLKNYLFRETRTGEEFICQAPDHKTAEEILELEGFDLMYVNFICMLSDYEKEMSGLDIY
jgi:hypothetical protein